MPLLLRLPLLLVSIAGLAAGEPVLGPFNQQHIVDSQNQRWDVSQDGQVVDGTSDCFDGGLVLNINGQQFQARNARATADGLTIVIDGVCGPLEVTRHIRIDRERAMVRYYEHITNPGGAAVNLDVQSQTYLGSSARGVTSSLGTMLTQGQNELARRESGLMSQTQSSRPSVAFLVTDPRHRVRPQVTIQSNRRINVSWTLRVGPRQQVAVLHAVAQRAGVVDAAALLREMAHPRFLRAGLSSAQLRLVANMGRGGAGGGAGGEGAPALASIAGMIDRLGLERGEGDLLAMPSGEEFTAMPGTASATSLAVLTRYGRVALDLADVAAIEGPRPGYAGALHLRNGEILRGALSAEGLAITGPEALRIPLDPQRVAALILKAHADDGKPREGVNGLLETTDGDRLAVSAGELVLPLVTAWGRVDLPLTALATLRRYRDPRPGLAVTLRDGSRFLALPAAATLAVQTQRFAEIEVPMSGIEAMVGGALAAPTEAAADWMEDEEFAQPHLVLSGGTRLVGGLAGGILPIEGPEGLVELPIARFLSAQRQEADQQQWQITLRDGGSMSGTIVGERVQLSGERGWSLPLRLVSIIRNPPQPEPEPEDSEDEEDAAEPAAVPAATSVPEVPIRRRVVAPAPTSTDVIILDGQAIPVVTESP